MNNMSHIPETAAATALAARLSSNPLADVIPARTQEARRISKMLWKHRWFLLTCVVIFSTAGWFGLRTILGPAVVVDHAIHKTLIETVVASGHVESPYRVEIGSQITGTVSDVLVAEGEHVHSGQPVITLDARELQSALAEAQGALAQAESRMRQLDEFSLPTARQALAQAISIVPGWKTSSKINTPQEPIPRACLTFA